MGLIRDRLHCGILFVQEIKGKQPKSSVFQAELVYVVVLAGGSKLLNAVATASVIMVCNSLFSAAVNAVSSGGSIGSRRPGVSTGKRESFVPSGDAGDRQVFLMSEAKFVGKNSESFPLPFRTPSGFAGILAFELLWARTLS